MSEALLTLPDVAFAHLVESGVPGLGAMHPAVFVWLQPDALRTLRLTLNQVSAAVAGALPEGRSVDVLILNSAPELLETVEAAEGLIVEADAGERRRALEAARTGPEGPASEAPRSRWWWPF